MAMETKMTMDVAAKAFAVWVVMAVLAVVNGIVRQSVLVPALGEPIGRPMSAVSMLVIVYLLTWLWLAWTGRLSMGQLWLVGALWVVLTVIFESALGVWMRGMSAAEIAATYDPFAPTLWFFVIVGILVAPPIVGALTRG